MFGLPMTFRTTLQENVIATHSRLVIVIISGDLFLEYFRVLREMEAGDYTQHQTLSYW